MTQQIIPMPGVPRGMIVDLDACQDDDSGTLVSEVNPNSSFIDEQLDLLIEHTRHLPDWEEITYDIEQRRARLNNDDAHWAIMAAILAKAITRLR